MNPHPTVAPRETNPSLVVSSRFVARFTELPELFETEFHHSQYAPKGRRAARGKDEGASQADGTFQWTPAVKVLAAYLLRCAVWARRCRDGTCPCLRGRRGSSAASLGYAMSKRNRWICDMFGCDLDGRPYLLDLIKRTNPDLKLKGQDLILLLDHGPSGLPPEQIYAEVGGTVQETAVELERLADAIEQSLKPIEAVPGQGCSTLMTIEGETEGEWKEEKQRIAEECLRRLGLGKLKFRVEKGSLKLIFEGLSAEDAERLFWAAHSGEFDELGFLDASYLLSGSLHTTPNYLTEIAPMAVTNRDRVGKALDLLNAGLRPFVERELKEVFPDRWQEVAREGEPPSRARNTAPKLDTQALLAIMTRQWEVVFKRRLGRSERSLVFEIQDIRNRWAHQETFSGNDTHRALDSIERLLNAVSAADEARQVEQMRTDLLRVQFDEQRRSEMRKVSFAPTEGKPQGGLKPWREVVTPHPDVATGRYQQAEFAADLWQVYLKEGSSEYRDPAEFFRRTFLTDGLRRLLTQGLLRLAGKGGDPVVQLQTNFGGGKTHSMLALYHLFSGTPATDLLGIDELVSEAGTPIASNVRRVVLVGTKISPGQPHKKPDGTVVRTLWGELAWQLGGKEAYAMLRKADETATNPGDVLKELFNRYAPCLVLIDEWVAYARQLHEGSDLPAGSFDTQFTFAQTIAESAKAARQTLLVVSIPASDNEIGGSFGQAALDRLKNAIGRVESSWRPASADEGFEIVRRRLFEPLGADGHVARDAVARSFVEMYGREHQEFPSECREAAYERRIQMAYPIHPELFDRLFEDWSTLDRFQRTRGVLRLMAAVIHSLWERQDGNLLILPGTIPIDDPRVQSELTRYLEDNWVPVLEKDIDGPNSLPLAQDRELTNLGRFSATRRIARTIYIGSAPTLRAANRGIDEANVRLGCVQPGETVATFNDALRRLKDRATYLYEDNRRYWYSTTPTVTRLADDRASQYDDDAINDEIIRRLKHEAGNRADFARIHVAIASGDLPDDREVRLVVLGPEHPHSARTDGSLARHEAALLLEWRGQAPRCYKNMLVFLAADATRLKELRQAVRQHLAWASIWDQRDTLNLDAHQVRQADARRKSADETVRVRIPETFQWLLVPEQPDPKDTKIEWKEIRLQGQDGLAVRAARKLKSEELLVTEMGGIRLRLELDRIPLWRGQDVSIRQLAEDMARYLYLPRLRDTDVLARAIEEGLSQLNWRDETFAYAEGYDEKRKRYQNLQAGKAVRVLTTGGSLLVKPDVAAVQMEQETTPTGEEGGPGGGPVGPGPRPPVGGTGPTRTDPVVKPPPKKTTRFYATVRLDPSRPVRDAEKVIQEVVQHLTALVGAEVTNRMEIEARYPDGLTEKLVRDLTENCNTLRFESCEFEQS
jgi:predicted AAA+ superfamily ATPase